MEETVKSFVCQFMVNALITSAFESGRYEENPRSWVFIRKANKSTEELLLR